MIAQPNNPLSGNHLKCPECAHECPLTDATGKTVQEPLCPKCHVIQNKQVKMVQVDGDGVPLDALSDAPVLSGKDMNALMYLLLKQVGTIEIPQEVFESAPGPEVLRIEMQWDKTNKVWRFFIMRKRNKAKAGKNLILPRSKGSIISN
jgi:hypothetical protein